MSIAFSFLTGMLLGGVAYASKQRRRRVGLLNSVMKLTSLNLQDGGNSLKNVHGLMKTLQEYGGTVVALGTTAVSIYTGLKTSLVARSLFALWVLLISMTAQGQVFDVAYQPESPTRTLLIPSTSPKALVLLFPGGGGVLRLQDDGSTKNKHTFVRSVDLWSQYHIDAVLVDTPYDLGDLRRGNLRERQDHMDRVGEVVQYYKAKTGLPIWIFGHSMGTSTATYFASQLNDQSKLLAGIIIAGTIRTASLNNEVSFPVLGIHHLDDACLGTPLSATKNIIEGRPAKFKSKMEVIEGGISEGNVCDSFAYHGFNQTESELVKRAAQFILSQ